VPAFQRCWPAWTSPAPWSPPTRCTPTPTPPPPARPRPYPATRHLGIPPMNRTLRQNAGALISGTARMVRMGSPVGRRGSHDRFGAYASSGVSKPM
jgi:hypothetical protein